MEKLELIKRVYQLLPGEIFWFSGNWRIVTRLDRDAGLVYYQLHGPSTSGKYETLMGNSKMMVALK